MDIEGLTDGTYFTLTTAPAHGTATIHPQSGNWTYTPNANYFGNDAFQVTVTDDRQGTTLSSLGVSILSVNDIPYDLDLNGSSIQENLPEGSFVGRFSAKDLDMDSVLSFALVDGNGSAHNSLFFIDSNYTLRTTEAFDYEAGFHFVIERENNQTSTLTDEAQNETQVIFERNSSETASDEGTQVPYDRYPENNNSSDHNGTEPSSLFDENAPDNPIETSDLNPTQGLDSGDSNRRSSEALGPEVDPTLFSIRVRVSDQHNGYTEKVFSIRLLNEIEDYDSDGIENAYDRDDALFIMPTLGPIRISVKENGRIFFLSSFQSDSHTSLPEFSFVISEDRDFERPVRTLRAQVENRNSTGLSTT